MEIIKDLLKPEIIWTLVGLGLLFLELMLPGLIVFFFGVGALIVAGICFFAEISINLQLGIFIVTSIALLIILRGLLKKVFMGHSKSADGDGSSLSEFVGERAIVKEKITPQRPGKVEFHGSNWAAIADGTIEEGATVEITAQDNITLKVKSL